MGLYLCIFDEDEEVDGVEVGLYSDFNALRDYVAAPSSREEPEARDSRH